LVKRYDTQTKQWSELAPMHYYPGQFARLMVLNGTLYSVGTHHVPMKLYHMERFDQLRNQWTIISAPMQTERIGFELKVFQEKLYAVGGYGIDKTTLGDPSASATCSSDQRQPSIVDTVEHYDETSSKWIKVASMNLPRLDAKVQAFKGKLYAIGGDPSRRSVECYDPLLDQWTVMAPLNTGRIRFGVGVLNGKLYVVGGYDQLDTFASVECYDEFKNQWTYVAPMTTGRYSHRVAELDGKLYAVGGQNHCGSIVNTVERYDDVSQQWSVVAPMNLRRSASSGEHICQVHQGILFTIFNQEPTDSGEWYDELTNQWTELITTR